MIPKTIVDSLDFASLPPEWIPTDLKRFSEKKTLYDYQQRALESAIKCLYLYFNQDGGKDMEGLKKNWYRRMQQTLQLSDGETEILDSLGIDNKSDRVLFRTLSEYYLTDTTVSRGGEIEYIPFWNHVNRMGFWMATGSGKSLVLIKLIEILDGYLKREMITGGNGQPRQDFLVLSYRED